MKKKGIKAMIRALNARHHTSNISRTLKRERIKLDTFKQQHILRDGKIDKRKHYFLILDDTAVRRYGKGVYGSGYNHSGSHGKTIWSNCLVTFQLREKKGR
jgi:DDE superfamily endonuclease